MRVRSTTSFLTAVVALATAPTVEARSSVANFSYCGFGFGAASSAVSKPGGTLTFMLGRNYRESHHFIESVASATTIDSHDRIFLGDIKPSTLKLGRLDDHLVVCIPELRYELVIAAHYCRGTADSSNDTPNGEMEEFIFGEAGEIWLSDSLYDLAKKDPVRAEASRQGDLYEGRAASDWRVRPFREVMPQANKPVTTNCSDLRLPDRN
jgi:hypothetical protein